MTIEFEAIEFETADAALQHFNASGYGDTVITIGGKSYVTRQAEADRLTAAGAEFAYLCDHEMPDGTFQIMTVPVN